MDEDTLTDDHVGSAKIDLNKYLKSPGEHKCMKILLSMFRVY